MKPSRVIVFVAACVLVPALGRAQSESELATRRLLLDQAQSARDDGNHERAIDLAKRAGTIRMTASVRRFVAEEQAALGLVAEALGNADSCVQDASAEQGANAEAVLAGCKELRATLHGKVGEIIVKAPEAIPGLVVKVAGSTLSQALYGVGYVVTPGDIVVDATAPDHAPFHTTVTVSAGAKIEVFVTLGAPSALPPPPHAAEPARARSPVGFFVLGGGALVLATAGVTALVSALTYSDMKSKCTAPSTCDQASAANTKKTVQALDTVTTVALIGGAVVAATGVVLILTLKRGAPRATVSLGLGSVSASFAF